MILSRSLPLSLAQKPSLLNNRGRRTNDEITTIVRVDDALSKVDDALSKDELAAAKGSSPGMSVMALNDFYFAAYYRCRLRSKAFHERETFRN
jgi:hypothetical protein